jgi:transglutaminase-like putative cysteine protease
MLLHVTHETRYEYAPPVETAQHLAHLKPLATDSQRLVSHKLAIEPPPAQRSEQADLYGNTRAFFALEATHDRLVVTAESVVETSVPVLSPAVARELPWESVRERFRFRKDATFDAASEFVFPSPYVPRHDDFAAYARASFAPGRPPSTWRWTSPSACTPTSPTTPTAPRSTPPPSRRSRSARACARTSPTS